MSLIIDGYNLLYAVGVLPGRSGPHGLERARLALLNFLAESLDPHDLPHTTVVFDAHDAPWGAPRTLQHHGLTVHFAANYDDADSLIEELIRRESAPRRLIVVSGDHRLQRAAHRRRATAIDSEAWYEDVVRQRRKRFQAKNEPPDRPAVPLLQEDVDYWLRQFGGGGEIGSDPIGSKAVGGSKLGDTGKVEALPKIDNPFPPGYAEELLAEDIVERPAPPDSSGRHKNSRRE